MWFIGIMVWLNGEPYQHPDARTLRYANNYESRAECEQALRVFNDGKISHEWAMLDKGGKIIGRRHDHQTAMHNTSSTRQLVCMRQDELVS